ncbi:glyoxylase-like metal-dependent hydrolase (beta-lactamase superfamily II) [Paraburkholderia sp. JPY162]|uniref:Glyoxylase-like metal-dependent hydrolase (Beta-lactamase superfamily II) n=2 Tax=Paraburkholderia youngii TaxID=2782701 RepID=A0A7W8LD75_9BURK|nr:glyoxylase-like metal-dependent hydrolase (beta-lactamase superfamily II) [Paraburkholderia youngii]
MMSESTNSTDLKWELLVKRRTSATQGVPPGKEDLTWVANTVTLIYGQRNAVLVDTFLSEEHTREMIDWIKAHDRNLETVYITHGHADHFFGLELVVKHFPNARAIASPQVVEAMHESIAREQNDGSWSKRFPGQIPHKLIPAQILAGTTFGLEGHELRVVNIGHTDTDNTTALHVPSIGLVISGDAIYNNTHPYLVESDGDGRRAWLAAIDSIEALNPKAVVAGHGPLDPDSSPRHIDATRQYVKQFERINSETETARELYDRMLELFPDRINPGSLWAAAHAAKKAAR